MRILPSEDGLAGEAAFGRLLQADARNVTACDAVDDNLLGLGVRLGAYFQFGAAIVALTFGKLGALGGQAEAAMLYTLVLLIVLAIKGAKGELSDAEMQVVLFLLWAQRSTMFIGLPLNAEMGTAWAAAKLEALKAHLGLRSDNRWHDILREKPVLKLSADRRRDVALVAMVALMDCVMALHLWFWAVGYADLQRPSALGCGGTRSFFFASVPSYGWFRVLQLLFLALVAGAQELWLTVLVLTKVFRSPRAPADSVGGLKYFADLPAAQANVQQYAVRQPLSAAQEERLLAALAPGWGVVAALWVFNLLGACFFVMSPEFLLHFNGLAPTASLADLDQMFAFLIGVATLAHSALAPRELPPHLERLLVAAEEEQRAVVQQGAKHGLVSCLWGQVQWKRLYNVQDATSAASSAP